VGSIITVTGNVFCISAPSGITADQCNWIINSPLAGSGDITNNNASSQTITYGGNNSAWTGRLRINSAMTVILSNTAALPGNPAVFMPDQIILNTNSVLQDSKGVTFNNANSGITLTGAATINASLAGNNTIIGVPITGAYGLTKSGGGILTLTGNNSFTGGLTFNGATSGSQLDINSANALGTGTFTISGGAGTIDNTSGSALTLLANNAQTWSTNFTFAGSSALNLGTGVVTLGANRTVTVTANTLTVGGTINGAYSLTKAGSGTLVLAASNGLAGGVAISAGTVVMSNTNALGTNGMTFSGTANATLDIATDGADYTNVVNAGSSTTFTIASDVKTGSTGINHTLGTFLIGSGATPLQMTIAAGPNVNGGSPQITASAMTLSGGSGGTTIIAPTTAKLSIGNLTASATSKTLQLDGTNTGNTITGAIADGGSDVITLVKTNTGTWTLSGTCTYSGNTTIGQGTLALSGSGSIASTNIVVGSAGIWDVSAASSTYTLGSSQILSGTGTVNGNIADSAGSQISPGGTGATGTLIFNNNLTLAAGDATKFDFSATTNDLVIVNGSLTPSAGSVINLNSLPAGGLVNGTYTLFRVSGTLGGSAANFTITGKPSPSRQTFAIVYDTASSPQRVLLQVTGSAGAIVWLGTSSAWDIVTTEDWTNSAALSVDYYFDGDNVSFTDLGSATSPILNTTVLPGSVTVNSANAYTLSGTGAINGSAGLTKSGAGTLTISTTNSYTGVTAINGGVISVASLTNGGVASPLGAATSASANLVLNGGALQYTGASGGTDHGATLGAGGGTVQITTAGSALSLSGAIVGSSGGSLTKSGNGTLVLSGANTYNGATTISGGVLQVGNYGTAGNLGSGVITDNAALVVANTGTLALTNNILGSGSVSNVASGTLTLSGTNTFTGGLTVSTGLVQIATAQSLGGTPAAFNPAQINLLAGELEASASLSLSDTNSGFTVGAATIAVDTNVTLAISNPVVSVTSLTKASPGMLILDGSNTLNGTLYVDTGSSSGSDGVLRIASTNALGSGGLTNISIRANQVAGSSTLQLDGTSGDLVVTQAFTWSGRNNMIPAVENVAGDNIWNPSAVTFVVGGTYYGFQCDAGSLTLAAPFPTTAPAAIRNILFSGNGFISVSNSGGIQSASSIINLVKTNSGTLTLWGANYYTGLTSIQGGTMNAADGSSFGNSTINSTNGNIEIAPYTGETATLNISNASVNAQRVIIGGVTGNTGTPGTGILNQSSGSIDSYQWFTVGSGGTTGGAGTYNMSGGTLNVHTEPIEVANFTASVGTVNLSGSGTINIWNSSNNINMGANANAGSGTFNQRGGTVTFYSDSGGTVGGSGVLYLGKATGLTNNYIYNLFGGTLQVPAITSASGNSLFYFNGGTLEAAKTNASFLSGLTAAYVSTNGAIIDSSSYAVTIAQSLVHDPALAAADGGLTSQSSASTGTLILTGTNTYTGPTLVNSGTLLINGSLGAGAVTVNGGTLGGTGVVAGATSLSAGTIAPAGVAVIGTLTISNSLTLAGGTVQFDLTRGSNDVLAVSGAVNVSGGTTILLTFPTPNVGTYTLIPYGSLAGFGNLSLSLSSPNPRFTFILTNDTSAKAIRLIAVGNSAGLVWKGDGSNNGWDNAGGYQNWLKGAAADYFYDGDVVTFNDSGSDSPSINITTTVSPGAVTVNATQNYDFAGSGLIAGIASLTKSGSGTLTLEDNNTYSGPTVITAGAVQVGNGSSSGSLGSGAVTNNGSLVFDRSDAIVMPAPIYGSGAVTMAGSGTLTATTTNYYTGPTYINSGIVYLPNSAGLGATNGAITVASGAQLYFTANVDFGANPLTLTGTGDGNGALRKGAAGTSTYNGAVILAGDTTIVADGSATLNLASTNGINGSAANANLTLGGAGAGVFSGPVTLGTGGLTVSGGTWTLAPTNSFTGLTTVNSGTLRVTGPSLGNPASFTSDQITLAGGVFEAATNVTFSDGLAGFTLNANTTFTVDSGSILTISNQISGSSALTKSGLGTLVLDGPNPFNGTLNVDTASTSSNDGSVRVASPLALANVASPIYQHNNNSGASILQLDASAGNLTIAQSLTLSCRNSTNANIENLSGSNTLAGTISIQSGGANIYFQSDAGTLNLAGTIEYDGTLNGTRTYNFTGAGNHVVSGPITLPTQTNAPINVAMSGTGTLILAAANTYSNSTTVNSGVMQVNGSITSVGGVTVAGGTLSGTGVINDAVTVNSGGTLSPGAGGIGTLTINSNLTLAGTAFIKVNKSAATHDLVTGVITANYGGTLVVSNLAGTLSLGDSFTVFSASAHSGTFAAISGSPGAGLAWSFNPASGVVSVVNGIIPYPTNLLFSVSGTNLSLSWPSDHIGWILQAQTNALATGLTTATNGWHDIPGSSSVTQTNIGINPANGTVFYRLRLP
jgi:autotransporter-associated beta strand protein